MTDGPHDDAMMMMDTVLRHLHNRTNAHSSAHGEFVIEGTVSQFPLLPPLSPITPVSPTPQFIPFTPVSLVAQFACQLSPQPAAITPPRLCITMRRLSHQRASALLASKPHSCRCGPRTIYPGTTFLRPRNVDRPARLVCRPVVYKKWRRSL